MLFHSWVEIYWQLRINWYNYEKKEEEGRWVEDELCWLFVLPMLNTWIKQNMIRKPRETVKSNFGSKAIDPYLPFQILGKETTENHIGDPCAHLYTFFS